MSNVLPNDVLKGYLEKREQIEKLVSKYKDYSGPDQIVSGDKVIKGDQVDLNPKLKSQITLLNDYIDGFKMGDLVTVSGISGMGKTEFCVTLTKDFIDSGHRPLWFSFEINERDMAKRFGDSVPYIYVPAEKKPNNLDWLIQRTMEAKAKHDITCVFIDHLHFLLDMNAAAKGNSSLLFGQTIRRIKTMALQLDIAIFLICHVNKSNMDDVPNLDDIRDSSFTYQEADTVLIVHRQANDKDMNQSLDKTKERYTEAKLRIAKNRWEGTIGVIPIKFDRVNRRFINGK